MKNKPLEWKIGHVCFSKLFSGPIDIRHFRNASCSAFDEEIPKVKIRKIWMSDSVADGSYS